MGHTLALTRVFECFDDRKLLTWQGLCSRFDRTFIAKIMAPMKLPELKKAFQIESNSDEMRVFDPRSYVFKTVKVTERGQANGAYFNGKRKDSAAF
jgi:hypothetical protein